MNPITITQGDTLVLSYQLMEDSVARDIAGMSFKVQPAPPASGMTPPPSAPESGGPGDPGAPPPPQA